MGATRKRLCRPARTAGRYLKFAKLFAALLFICYAAKAQDFTANYNFINTGTSATTQSFANTGITSFFIFWSPQVTLVSCAVQVDSSADGVTWGSGDLIASQNCATAGSSGSPQSLASGKNFLRIHVTALIGNGGLNVGLKGWGGGGSGVTVTSSNAIDLSQPPYSLKTALFVNDASSTNTSKTITCPNSDCNFTASMVGQKVYGICSSGQGVNCPPVGTITAFNSASSITVSNAATVTSTGNVVFVYGPDSTSALTAATTAANALCANTGSVTVNFPVGLFLTSLPEFNNPPANCGQLPISGVAEQGGITFKGQGKFTSALVPTPDFAFRAAGQFFSNTNFGSTTNLINLGINGLGWDCGSITTGAATAIVLGTNGFVNHFSMLNWCTNPTDSFTDIAAPSAGYLQQDTVIDGAGTTGVKTGGACCNQIYGGWIDNLGNGNPGTGFDIVVSAGGSLYTHNMQIGLGSHVPGVQVGVGSTWVSDGDQINVGQGATCIDARNNNATVVLRSTQVLCAGFTTFQGILTSTNTGVSIIAQDSTIQGGATGNWLNGGAGTTFTDKGGNSYTGPLTFTGRFVGQTNSARNTACATGNFALTSGWGTSSVTSVAANGDIQGCHVTITGAAGSAGPVLTWTYPQAPPTAPGSCHLSGVSGTLTGVSTGSPGATTVAYTFGGTPSAQTYNFDTGCP